MSDPSFILVIMERQEQTNPDLGLSNSGFSGLETETNSNAPNAGGLEDLSGISSRLQRLEWLDEIRQLVAKYALALDMRNMDALVSLFPTDVRVGKGRQGRTALKEWFDETLRHQFTGTAHVTGNHIIEFDDEFDDAGLGGAGWNAEPDRSGHPTARGVVYSRNEHECGDEWVIMTMMYWDNYELINDRWLFRRRLPLYWYATDLNKPPIGSAKMRWPGRERYDGGWEKFWPSWDKFWKTADADVSVPVDLSQSTEVGAAADTDLAEVDIARFLTYMRAGTTDLPSVRVR